MAIILKLLTPGNALHCLAGFKKLYTMFVRNVRVNKNLRYDSHHEQKGKSFFKVNRANLLKNGASYMNDTHTIIYSLVVAIRNGNVVVARGSFYWLMAGDFLSPSWLAMVT